MPYLLMRIYENKKTLTRTAPAFLSQLRRTFVICRQFRHVFKTTPKTFDQVPVKCSFGRRYPVMVPQAISSRANKARLAKVRKVPRGCGLRNPNGTNDVSHAKLPAEQKMQNSQPRAIRKSPELQIDLSFRFPQYIRLSDYS